MNRALVAVMGCMLFTGCAAVAPFAPLLSGPLGSPSAQVSDQTTVELYEDNFQVVKTNVIGHSLGFSLLGLITIVPPTLTKAMAQFYKAAEVQTGRPQTPAHLIIERSSTYYILFGIPRVDVRADIVEFTPKAAREGDDARKGLRHKPPDTSQ